MILYFIISGLALTASLFFFLEHIVISGASLVPIALIGISVFQAIVFTSQKNEGWNGNVNPVYATHDIDEEATRLALRYHSLTKLVIIPPLCIFIIYFDTAWKIALPLCIWFLSFLPVRLLVKHGKKDKA